MSKGGHPVHFANFICHIGHAELADVLKDIVIPAFLTSAPRTFRDIKYHLHQVSVSRLEATNGHPEPVIMGRLIKDMIVRSEQRFDVESGQLLKARQQLHSSPSAVFVLLLKSHKLIYCHETSGAPAIEAFRSTITTFLEQARDAYIRRLHAEAQNGGTVDLALILRSAPKEIGKSEIIKGLEKPTLKFLREIIPEPILEVVPLANEDTLRDFVQRFKVLESASVRLLRRNAELDNDDFFEAVRDKGSSAGSEVSTITYKSKSGLAKGAVVEQLESALTGNAEITLSGKDDADRRLRGTNEEFKAVAKLSHVPASLVTAANALFAVFREYVKKGLVKLASPQHSAHQVQLIESVLDAHQAGAINGRTESQ